MRLVGSLMLTSFENPGAWFIEVLHRSEISRAIDQTPLRIYASRPSNRKMPPSDEGYRTKSQSNLGF